MDLSFFDLNFNSVENRQSRYASKHIKTARLRGSLSVFRQFCLSVPRGSGYCAFRRGRYTLLHSLGRRLGDRHSGSNQYDMLHNARTQAQIVGYFPSGSFNSRRLGDIVNYIRLNPESLEEWHQSGTAKLFAPPIFHNEKKASGYFF